MLNSSEAWSVSVWLLTTREKRVVISATDDSAPIAELIKRYCEANKLPEVTDQWPNELIFPTELATMEETKVVDRDFVKEKVVLGTCEGSCLNHVGPVRAVRVTEGLDDFGRWAYCEAAIERNREQGYKVTTEETL